MMFDLRRDEGLTLVEMIVATALLVLVAFIFLPMMEQTSTRTSELSERNRSVDEARIALQTIDREFRGADRICRPEPGDTGSQLTFRTRTSVRDEAIDRLRVDYQVVADTPSGTFRLERSEDRGGSWRTVARGLVNADPFTLEGDVGPTRGEVLDVVFQVDADTADRAGPVLLSTSLSARNIYNPTQLSCNP